MLALKLWKYTFQAKYVALKEYCFSRRPATKKCSTLTSQSQCVDQAELEKFDGVSQGKYTIGLGQTKMSFCDDREGNVIIHLEYRDARLMWLKISTQWL